MTQVGVRRKLAHATGPVQTFGSKRRQVGIAPVSTYSRAAWMTDRGETLVQAGLKSSQIMQQESTSSRAGSLAADWYYLGRVRTLDEMQAAINGLTPEGIVDHLRRCPAKDFTVVTLGPNQLTVKG